MGIIIKLGHFLSGITSLGEALLSFFLLPNSTYKTSNMIHSSAMIRARGKKPVIQKDTTSTMITLNCGI